MVQKELVADPVLDMLAVVLGYWKLYLFIIFLIIILRVLFNSIVLVNQAEVVVIERLGKFFKVLHPGLHLLVPFVDVPRYYFWSVLKLDPGSGRTYRHTTESFRIDLREAVFDFPKQNVITKDNVTMEISAIVYYHVTDPIKTLYEIQNLPEAIEKLAQTKLREVIGSLDLDETLVSRDYINEKLRGALFGATDGWGVALTRVELQEINPPKDIKIAMEKQMRAERDRRANVLEAEGEKQASVLRAEGEMLSKIQRANGEAESTRILAEAEARSRQIIAQGEQEALLAIAKANPGIDPAKYLLAIKYISSLSDLSSDSKTVIIPYEATALLGSVSTIKEIFGGVDNKPNV